MCSFEVEPPSDELWYVEIAGHPEELFDAQDFVERHYSAYYPYCGVNSAGLLIVRMRWNSKAIAQLFEQDVNGHYGRVIRNEHRRDEQWPLQG